MLIKMHKNAEELSLQTIVVFLIIIIVVVILLIVFRDQFGVIANYFSNIIKDITSNKNPAENLINK